MGSSPLAGSGAPPDLHIVDTNVHDATACSCCKQPTFARAHQASTRCARSRGWAAGSRQLAAGRRQLTILTR